MSPERVAGALRAALAGGDHDALAELYAQDAALDVCVQGARERARGPQGAAELLGRLWPGPGELVEWAAGLHPEGLDVWVERVGEEGASRSRQYLWVRDGEITRHWVYGGTPRSVPGPRAVELDPALLSELGEVASHEPIVSRGWSGNELETVTMSDGRRLVAKRVVPERNWLERLTDDRCREALLFRDGVLDRLPAVIDHAIVAAVPDEEGGWWLVMRDVTTDLLPDDRRISREENRRVLAAVNGMWEEFWGEEVPHTCSTHRMLRATSHAAAAEERDRPDLIPHQFDAFWEAFDEAVPDDVSEPVLRYLEDPAPLVAALAECGTTLIHGDLRDEQLGIAEDRVVILDWGVATQAHPVVELSWFMPQNAWRTDCTRDEFEEDFRRARGDADDPVAIELGMIAGLVRYGWIFGHSAAFHPAPAEREWGREELDWWVPRVRRALEATGLG